MLIRRSQRICLLLNVAGCQWFHVGRRSSQKRNWTKEEITLLQAWKYETNVVYGPLVNFRKARDTVSITKRGAMLAVSTDDLKLTNSQAAVGFTANVLRDNESDMADLPCSVSRHISSETVLEDAAEKPVVTNSFNSANRNLKATKKTETKLDMQKDDEIFFDSTNRDGTFSYTWVNRPAQLASAKKVSREEDTVMSFTETANINVENVKQNREEVSCHVGGVSDTETDSLSENNSQLETDKDKTDGNDMAQNVLLSFPLFDSPVSPAEPASLSTRFPSVSAILKATMSPESQLALSRWEQRMIAELGEDGFRQYQTALFANGSNLHAAIHQYLSGKPAEQLDLLPANDGHWRSIESVLDEITGVVCLEKFMRHTQLQYCGVLDCVAEYRGEQYVIDWKTSKRRKSNLRETFDNPLQLVAYLGAYNIQPSTSLKVERCLLVIGYEDGSAADVHMIDRWHCLQYWSSWLRRLHLYRVGTDVSPSSSL